MKHLSVIMPPIEEKLEEFKVLFDSSLSSSNPLLNEVITHIRQKDGKMMRPILVLLIAELFGEINKSTLHSAAALELLHTASLVHDDVVDESSQRRGQLSVNALFNNKVAVLVGDFLLATCLIQAGSTANVRIINVVASLGRDLSEGELLQLSNIRSSEFSEEIYFDVIRKKTAALFAACTTSGALSVNASAVECDIAHVLGEYIGICFQIKDDIFDYYKSWGIGKPTGNDMIEGKLTLPVLFALNSTGNANAKKVAYKVKDGTATTEEINYLIDFTKKNGGIEYAERTMLAYSERALALLSGLPDTDVKAALVSYLNYVVDREK